MYGGVTNNKGTLARSYTMCGVDPRQAFAGCELFIDCFEAHDSADAWEECMERDVHSHMHAWHGGAWDCALDVEAWLDEHPKARFFRV